MLYEADEPEAPICVAMHLLKLEPMLRPRLWSAIRDALLRIPAKQAGSTKVRYSYVTAVQGLLRRVVVSLWRKSNASS